MPMNDINVLQDHMALSNAQVKKKKADDDR